MKRKKENYTHIKYFLRKINKFLLNVTIFCVKSWKKRRNVQLYKVNRSKVNIDKTKQKKKKKRKAKTKISKINIDIYKWYSKSEVMFNLIRILATSSFTWLLQNRIYEAISLLCILFDPFELLKSKTLLL